MKIIKGIVVAIIFAAATLGIGFFIYLETEIMLIAPGTLFGSLVMARLGYSVGTGHINSFGFGNKK